jgi:hypothetical protein
MPTIYANVDVDVDVEIDEFVDSCSERNIKSLIRYLVDSGHLKPSMSTYIDSSKMTTNEIDFYNKMDVLATKYYQMSVEETEMIENLYNKYR